MHQKDLGMVHNDQPRSLSVVGLVSEAPGVEGEEGEGFKVLKLPKCHKGGEQYRKHCLPDR